MSLGSGLSHGTLGTTLGEMILHITQETEYLKTVGDFQVCWHSERVHSSSVHGHFPRNSSLGYALFNLVKEFLLSSVCISNPSVLQVIKNVPF